MRRVIDSMELIGWPEFIALANRMGIPLDVNTQRLQIDLKRGSAVIVTHEHLGADKAPESETSLNQPIEVNVDAMRKTLRERLEG